MKTDLTTLVLLNSMRLSVNVRKENKYSQYVYLTQAQVGGKHAVHKIISAGLSPL